MKITTYAVRLLSITAAQAAVLKPASTPEPTRSVREDEYTVFGKRHILEERDYDLAEKHGVDLSEMRKHSVVERDGKETTFWVNKAFSSNEKVMIERRDSLSGPDEPTNALRRAHKAKKQPQGGIDVGTTLYRPKFTADPKKDWFCHNVLKVEDITNDKSPSVKTIANILAWAKSNPGHFDVLPGSKELVPLVIAGSEDGTNAALTVKQNVVDIWYDFKLGTHDIGEIIKTSVLKMKGENYTAWEQIGTRAVPDFKMATSGGIRCNTKTPRLRLPENPWIEFELTSFEKGSKLAEVYPPDFKSFNRTTPSASTKTPTPTLQSVRTASGIVWPPGWMAYKAAELKTLGSAATPTPQTTETALSSSAMAIAESISSAEKTNSTVIVQRSVPTLQPVVNILNGDILQPVFRAPTPTVETPVEAKPTISFAGDKWPFTGDKRPPRRML